MKLNLGCGIHYVPDYVNIDRYEALVADEAFDLTALPFAPNSIEEIRATHVLEHFDMAVVPYVLASWYHLLQQGGRLHLELPHVPRLLHHVPRKPGFRAQQWVEQLYGADLPGNIHKSGFSPTFLQTLLLSTGFHRITRVARKDLLTHAGPTVFGFDAWKPASSPQAGLYQWIATLRAGLLSTPSFREDIFLLRACESHVLAALTRDLLAMGQTLFSAENFLPHLLNALLLHPAVALRIYQQIPASKASATSVNLRISPPSLPSFSTVPFSPNLEWLDLPIQQSLPGWLLSLWSRSRKSGSSLSGAYSQFHQNLKELFAQLIQGSLSPTDALSYLRSIPPIQCSFFGIETIIIEGIKLRNRAIRAFSHQDCLLGLSLLQEASAVNPWDLDVIQTAFMWYRR